MQKWRQFELAVAKFVSALDPKATVTPNVYLPDRHTGAPRQRDVWVEAMVCNIFQIKILISCKLLQRKFNEQDMDAFLGELQSSSANMGVIYTARGFTEQALEKANLNNITCCKLYQDQPPIFRKRYFSISIVRILELNFL